MHERWRSGGGGGPNHGGPDCAGRARASPDGAGRGDSGGYAPAWFVRRVLGCSLACALAACGAGGSGGGKPDASAGTGGGTLNTAPFALALANVVTVPDAVFLTAPAGDSRLFVVTRKGAVRIVQDGVAQSTPLLDISALVSTEGEGGLLSMAFDPRYSSNGYVYLYYIDVAHNIVLARRTVPPGASVADPSSALVLLRIPHDVNTNHYGGLVSFGPDGYLYLGTGDGGGAGDAPRNAQNLTVLLGKLLRLDVSNASAAQPYAIPPGNPFSVLTGARPEIWAFGLRNPWRYSFDASTLYIADVGQDRREEVDIVASGTAGLNYGWNVMEGTLCYNASTCSQAGLTLPAFDYDHGSNGAGGCAITGGYVYRGKALPELLGRYLYSDYCLGFLKSFVGGASVTEQKDWAIGGAGQVVSFGRDADGELYLIGATGAIVKIVRKG
jgi:glucose/arabinose dehydrogenase